MCCQQHFTVSTAQINEDLARWRKRQMKQDNDKFPWDKQTTLVESTEISPRTMP